MTFEQFESTVRGISALGWRLRLTEVQNGWVADWQLSPASFGTTMHISAGDKRSAFYFAVINFHP